MKKICAIVTISGLCLLAAAGIWALSTNTGSYSAKNQSVNSGETATFPKTTITDSISQHSVSPEKTGFTKHSTDDQPKILIAYFTWADNTTVTDSDAAVAGALRHYQAMGDAGRYSETDAVSSASLIPPGNTAVVAGFIRDAVGGDLFSIQVTEPYSPDYDQCLDQAAEEKARNSRPALANRVEDMDKYDIVFLGYPNWWYSVPMAVLSFAESYDFNGKTVIPFCCHGTGGLAGSLRDLRPAFPNSTNFVNNAFGVYRPDTLGCQPEVNSWLRELGFEF